MQQNLPPAPHRLGKTQQSIQPPVVGILAVRRRNPLVNLGTAQANIVGPVQRQRLGRRAIPPRAADFLILALDRLGQIGMGDPADIRLVDPHAKGHRRHHDQPVFLLKPDLDPAAILGIHAAMIETRGMRI